MKAPLGLVLLANARAILESQGIAVRPLTIREIEEISGVRRSTVHNAELRALAKLRAGAAKREI